MSNTTLIVDGDTLIDHPLDAWQQRPPEALSQLINPDVKSRVWMRVAMMALTDALLAGRPVLVDIRTHPQGFAVDVQYRDKS